MIANSNQFKQLPNEIKSTFNELNVLKHLRNAGIKKSFGFTCAYVFHLIFCLIFEHRNWFQLLETKKSTEFAYRLIDEAGIVVVPGNAFGKAGEGYVRIGLTQGRNLSHGCN